MSHSLGTCDMSFNEVFIVGCRLKHYSEYLFFYCLSKYFSFFQILKIKDLVSWPLITITPYFVTYEKNVLYLIGKKTVL